MVLPIVPYGTPVLRKKCAPVPGITEDLRRLIADMFETMAAADGVGLAAPQVGHAIQLALVDVRDVPDRPSQLWLEGREANVDAFMPLVLINPRIQPVGDPSRSGEGCLSFPDIYGDVVRPAEVEVVALNERGEEYRFKAGGLLSRAVQHEVDHLNGILFIDRMDSGARDEVKADVEALLARTKAAMAKKR
jgi:peptide deformylase